MALAVALVMATVFLWGVLSARLDRADLSAPIVFVTVGVLLAEVFHVFEPSISRESTQVLAEVTLVWVLFADASRIGLREFRADLGVYVRLLGVGLALTIISGALLAAWLLGMGVWMAVLVGAALAPTDAALGSSVMTNPVVPERIRRILNVESGLNDGIATPVVVVAIAGVAATESIHGLPTVAGAIADLAIGLTLGIGVGAGGGMAMRKARRRGWDSEDFAGPAVLALALLAYALTIWVDGNGFVAAFVGGLAFGNSAGAGGTREVYYVEQTSGLVSVLTWLVFGAIGVPIVWEQATWQIVTYAVLSLTIVRMVPVALSLIGTGMPPATVAFVGWFGPRGLASVIFALIAADELDAGANGAVAVIGMTVLISVFAHGVSAKPLATRYGARVPDGSGPSIDPPRLPAVRGLLRRHPVGDTKGVDR